MTDEGPMGDLGPEARALVDAAREADGPTERDRHRVRRALMATLAAGAAGTAAPTVSTAAAAGAATAAKAGAGVVVKKVLLVTMVTGALGGGAVVTGVWPGGSDTPPAPQAAPASPAPDRAAPHRAPAVVEPSLDRTLDAEDAADEPSVVPTPEGPTPTVAPREAPPAPQRQAPQVPARMDHVDRAATSTAPGDASEDQTGLSEELALLRSAQQALRTGDGVTALERAEAHLDRFPEGALRVEAEAARVLALCALDRRAEARRAAERFLARASGSPLVGQVRTSCAFTEGSDEAAGEH